MIPQADTPSVRDQAPAPVPASADGWMPVITEHLPPRFAADDVLERLASRLRLLPAQGLIALELHLSRDEPQIDLSQRFEHAGDAIACAERLGDASLMSLLGPWQQGELRSLGNVWFEMDILPAENGGGRPEVLTCSGIAPDSEPEWVVERLAPCFRSGGFTPEQRRTVKTALEHLEEAGGHPIYLFDLEPRSPGLTRLDTLGLDQDAMIDFAKRFAPEPTVRQVRELPSWMNDVGRHHFSFDVLPDGSVGPRLGTELSNVKLPHRDARWGRLFDQLVGDGLCDRETRDAIEAWTGQDDQRTGAAWWPASPELTGGCCVRCVSHIKLVSWPDRPLEAKAYLLVQFLDGKRLKR